MCWARCHSTDGGCFTEQGHAALHGLFLCPARSFPFGDAVMMRTRPGVVFAEAVCSIAALSGCSFRHVAGSRVGRRMDDVSRVIPVVTVLLKLTFVWRVRVGEGWGSKNSKHGEKKFSHDTSVVNLKLRLSAAVGANNLTGTKAITCYLRLNSKCAIIS